MPIYFCGTCEYTTEQKSRMDAHRARKNPCKPKTLLNELVEKKVREVLATAAPTVPVPPVVPSTPINITNMTPFLKWVGGKTQIIDAVLNLFPTTIKNYHEPFVGGGSVLLALLSHVKAGKITMSGKAYASDLNPNIINLYKTVQSNPEGLIAETRALITVFAPLKGTTINRKPAALEEALTSQESYYYWIRAQFNALSGAERQTPKAAAMCLFMNKTNFRGVYRDGPNGFNVPFGHYTNPAILHDDHIRQVSALIRDVVFTAQPFSDSLTSPADGDFVYLDPPYAPETANSFVGYTGDGFGLDHHALLFRTCTEMRAKNVKMLMSNANVKLVRDAFPSPAFQTHTVQARRAIHSKTPDATTTEVLITN
jgi:DNA adenine methylase